jgi:hypothetical protein
MLSSAITLFLFAAVGPIAVAAAPQLPDVGAAPPATTPSALELGVRLTRIALDGALVAAQQMLALEQALAGGSVGSESGASSSVSTRVAGSAPNSSPVRTTVVLGHEKTFLRPQRQNEQQLPVDQQIRAAHVSFPKESPGSGCRFDLPRLLYISISPRPTARINP